jgi:hypothetical protein
MVPGTVWFSLSLFERLGFAVEAAAEFIFTWTQISFIKFLL